MEWRHGGMFANGCTDRPDAQHNDPLRGGAVGAARCHHEAAVERNFAGRCQRICQEDAESLLRLKLHDPQRHVWSLPQYQRQQHCCHGVAYPDAANQLLRVEIIQGCQDDVFILAVVNDPGR